MIACGLLIISLLSIIIRTQSLISNLISLSISNSI
nr:MAG TPA: hypothetical protein [Crassvirales sp.]